MAKDLKRTRLGMDPGTAANRLVKDLLFDLAMKAGHKCFRCSGDLTRETFSIEHKESWLRAPEPAAAFFDLSNVAFSHLACNSSARHRTYSPCGTRPAYKRGCRCDQCRTAERNRVPKRTLSPAERHERYLKYGC